MFTHLVQTTKLSNLRQLAGVTDMIVVHTFVSNTFVSNWGQLAGVEVTHMTVVHIFVSNNPGVKLGQLAGVESQT